MTGLAELARLALAALGGGVLVALIRARANRKLVAAKADASVSEAWAALVTKLESQVDRLEEKVDQLGAENRELRERLDELGRERVEERRQKQNLEAIVSRLEAELKRLRRGE